MEANQKQEPIIKKIEEDTLKIRCPFCFHNKARRSNTIEEPDKSFWVCENCNRRIR